ncbi:MAG: acetate--CoA ligase [Alphaproteobacteria bacterium]|nr:acetate--CoA ligase [Alphaproteobacteria bacterium]
MPESAFPPILKDLSALPVRPNLVDYEAERAAFSWEAARGRLDGLPSGGLHIAHEAVDRHAAGPRAEHPAIIWRAKDGRREVLTYRQLSEDSSRFANALRALGVKAGDAVYLLMGRVPELYVAALGALKNQCVVCPLFAAFGPEPIHQRLEIGEGRVLITTPALYRRKVEDLRGRLPALEHVLLVGDRAPVPEGKRREGTLDFHEQLSAASADFTIPATDPETPALMHFTSGTTGKPKGAVHVHGAVLHHHVSGYYALDLHPEDVFWCTADPGWVTGTSYGIISPLTHGLTLIVNEPEFDAEGWYRVLQEERVTVWYTAPTAVRMMMKLGEEAPQSYDTSALRFIASVGEPLNPEGVVWGQRAFGLPIHDNWWQTETGGVMIANLAAVEIRPGSMGRPLPGIEAAVVRRVAADKVEVITTPGEQGELALRPGWPSMMRAYLHEEARYQRCFVDGWYLSGDLATVDADGFFWFVGRADDVINTSGHLVGPFEVESALMEHPAVAEAGVIGKPDPVAMEIVKAFVALKPGFEESEELRRELHGLTRKRLGAAVAPKEIEFLPGLPKTRSGKIMRRLLKARELGLPEGDTSTLEEDPK